MKQDQEFHLKRTRLNSILKVPPSFRLRMLWWKTTHIYCVSAQCAQAYLVKAFCLPPKLSDLGSLSFLDGTPYSMHLGELIGRYWMGISGERVIGSFRL